jgi:hypothetical protein
MSQVNQVDIQFLDQGQNEGNHDDDDGDGVADGQDAFPQDASEWLDTDSDSIGDNADDDPNCYYHRTPPYFILFLRRCLVAWLWK